jgi:hypothetical protein
MYFHIEYWSSNDNEVTGYSSWKDKEQDVQVKLGVIKETPAFEVVAITSKSVTIRKAEGQQASYGTFGPGPSSRAHDKIVRSKEEILYIGQRTSVSEGWTYNGSSHDSWITLTLKDGVLPGSE